MLSRIWTRVKAFLARHPWVVTVAAGLAFVCGTVWRWVYVLRVHDPRDYVFSDMERYIELVKRMAQPGYTLVPSDVSHPMGFPTVMLWLYRHDPTMHEMSIFQLVVCVLAPLSVAALAWATSGRL